MSDIKFNPNFEEYIKGKTLWGVLWGFMWRWWVAVIIIALIFKLFGWG